MDPFLLSHEPYLSGELMKHCSTPGEESLAEYIVLATFGLVSSARERIQMEIEAHYAEDVSRRLGEGMSQEQAEIAAVQELGDPGIAARQYRKRYLTEEEVSWLRQFEGRGRSQWPTRTIGWIVLGLGIGFVSFVLLAWLAFSTMSPGLLARLFSYLLAVWLSLAVFIGAAVRSQHWRGKLPSGPGLWRKLLKLSLVQFPLGCLYCAAQLLSGTWVLGVIPNELAAGILILSILPVFLSKRFRLWRKLRFKQLETAKSLA
jgi:hypothetical protein